MGRDRLAVHFVAFVKNHHTTSIQIPSLNRSWIWNLTRDRDEFSVR